MESKIGEANSHTIIFGWCEHFLMAISCVCILVFEGHMESKTGEANTHLFIFS
jgi:hypothetical protein